MATKFLLSLISRILPLTIACVFATYADSLKIKIAAYSSGVVILVIAEYAGIYRPLLNLEEHKRKLLDYYFDSFVKTAAIGDEKVAVRINVMLVRWNWVNRHFFQYYQNGMAGNSDSNLHFSIKKGFCGKVFQDRTHEVRFVDLTKMTKKRSQKAFGFSNHEAEITANIKAVACIPLYREEKQFGEIQTQSSSVF